VIIRYSSFSLGADVLPNKRDIDMFLDR
jgi:hypothetical protein